MIYVYINTQHNGIFEEAWNAECGSISANSGFDEKVGPGLFLHKHAIVLNRDYIHEICLPIWYEEIK